MVAGSELKLSNRFELLATFDQEELERGGKYGKKKPRKDVAKKDDKFLKKEQLSAYRAEQNEAKRAGKNTVSFKSKSNTSSKVTTNLLLIKAGIVKIRALLK